MDCKDCPINWDCDELFAFIDCTVNNVVVSDRKENIDMKVIINAYNIQ